MKVMNLKLQTLQHDWPRRLPRYITLFIHDTVWWHGLEEIL